MRLSRDQVLEIMAWSDGEIDAGDEDRIAALVASSPEAQELVRSFDALGELVRASDYGASACEVRLEGPAGLVDAVMARAQPDDLDRARMKRAQKGRVVLVAATLAALAAGVLVYARTGPVQISSPDVPLSASISDVSPHGVQVDELDTQDNGVSVFYVAADDTKTPNTTVVWIDDSTPAVFSPTPSRPPSFSPTPSTPPSP